MLRLCLLAAWAAFAFGQIVSIVTTDSGVERGATALEVPAYYLYNDGVAASKAGDVEAAVRHFRGALVVKPDLPEAHINLGNLLGDAAANGAPDLQAEAMSHYEAAVRCADHPKLLSQALSNLGHNIHRTARGDVGALSAAFDALEAAVAADGNFVDARFNFGSLLQDLGRRADARREYEAALALDPKHENARLNLANLFFADGDSTAAARLQQSLVDDASLSMSVRVDALNNLGQTFRDAGEHARAADFFRRALELGRGDSDETPTSLSNLITARRTLCSWEGHETLQLELVRATRRALRKFRAQLAAGAVPSRRGAGLGLMPYDATLLGAAPSALVTELARFHLISKFAGRKRAAGAQRRPGALRVGYLSFDLREHPMGYLTRRLLSSPRYVQVVALSYGEDDNSTIRKRAETMTSAFVELKDTSVTTAAALVEAQGLDVVFDLMAHTRGARLELAAAVPPEAVLLNYLGYPGTAGGAHYDGTIADATVAPVEALNHFAEPLVLLPGCYQANDYGLLWPAAALDGSAAVDKGADGETDAAATGDTDSASIGGEIRLCNFNQLDKFEPQSFALWMNVLRRLPRARLTLLRPREELAKVVMPALAAEAVAAGVAPWRVAWAPRASKQKHLERLQRCEVFLDHAIYGAHTTGADALWAGVPLLAIRGFGGDEIFGRFASRVGASLLRAVGLEELAVSSLREYEDVAARLGSSQALRRGLRRSVLAGTLRSKGLFDSLHSVDAIEAAAHAAVEIKSAVLKKMQMVVTTKDASGRETRSGLQDCTLREVTAIVGSEVYLPGPDCRDDADADDHAAALEAPLYDDDRRRLGATLRFALAHPRDADARSLRGLALYFAKRYTEAADELRVAAALAPHASHFWSNFGHVLGEAGDGPAAAAAYVAALRRSGRPGDDGVKGEGSGDAALLASVSRQLTAGVDAGDVRGVEAAQALFAAATLDAGDHRLRLRLGAALDAVGDAAGAHLEWREGVLLKNAQAFQNGPVEEADLRTTVEEADLRTTVAVYCDEYGQTWWPRWGPSSLEAGGLGGSEEAVVFVSREVAKLGHAVRVYADPPDFDVGADRLISGLEWLPLSAFDVSKPLDVFVAWRYHISAHLGLAVQAKTFVWLQDIPPYTSWAPDFVEQLGGILTLSQFHTRTLPPHARSIAKETPNGIDPTFYVDGPNYPRVLAYGSAPNRGLYDVLRLWPGIYDALGGNVTLVVYYGFSNSFRKWGRANMPGYDRWEDTMHQLLGHPGVDFKGMVDHATLARGYAEAGFIVYPTTYPETGCVSVMKAMALGAIPVTSRHADSVVPELTRHWDLGPPSPRTAPSAKANDLDGTAADDDRWLETYASAVVDAVLRAERGELNDHRAHMKRDSRDRFAWRHVAKLMADSFAAANPGTDNEARLARR
ncbi:glycosyl transferase family 41-domain-containing protein [Pelagophyceae sp. CCMP2097]|nr:glycosyl transferase family 41-domain-containing protein [Pelagophyceae sp. CCMP2097]